MISDERLEWLLISPGPAGRDEQNEIVKELLAMRKAAIPDEFLNATQNASGMFELSEDCMCRLMSMLCSKPTDRTT